MKETDQAAQERRDAQRREYEEQGNILLSACVKVIEGDRFLIKHGETVVYDEGRLCGYAGDAWLILCGLSTRPARPGRWKTLAMFRTVRQAVREMYAQGTGLEDPPAGASRKAVETWLTIARHYDARHHGQETF